MSKKAKRGKDSDEEDEEIELGEKKKEITKEEQQAIELADVPTIPESEVSPAAYIF